jgi:hypothetical protein
MIILSDNKKTLEASRVARQQANAYAETLEFRARDREIKTCFIRNHRIKTIERVSTASLHATCPAFSSVCTNLDDTPKNRPKSSPAESRTRQRSALSVDRAARRWVSC